MADFNFYSHFNRSAFLHVEYCPPKGDPNFKLIKFWAGQTENGQTVRDSVHYVSYKELRFLCFLILSFNFEDKQVWKSIKGKVEQNKTTCRVMKVSRDDEIEDVPKFFLTLGHGPGKADNDGRVFGDSSAPRESWSFTTLVFTEEEIIKFALEIQVILNGIAVSQILSVGI